MPDFAVNIPGEPREDLSGFAVNAPAQGGSQPAGGMTANISGLPDDLFAKYSQGPTAQLMPADPKKGYGTSYYAAYTNDGDMAGAVMVADGQKVRLVDKMTGDVVFEGVGPEGARLATSVANGISQDMGRKAAWAIQKPTDEGGWVSMAEERYDPKEQSTLGKLADFALPILGAILMPVTGGMSAAIAAGLGSAAGSALSSIAQGRSVEETLKRAAIAGVTAGVGAKVMPMVGNALAPKSAMTDMLVAAQNKAIEMGVSTQPFSSALAAEAAKTAAEQPIRSALSKAYDVTTGAVDDAAASVRGAVKGALSTATDVGKTALEKVASNAVAGTVSPVSVFGTAAPGAATGALAGAGAGAALPGALTGTSGQPTLRGGDNTGTKIDEVEVTGERPGTDTGAVVGGGLAVDTGTPVSEVKVVADKPPGTDTGAVVGGGLAVDTGTPVSEVKVVADKPPGTDTGAVVGDVLTGSEGNDTLEDTSTDDEVKDKTGLKVDPKLVELVLTLLGGAGGAAAGDKKGPSTLPPGFATAGTPGSLSDRFRAKLPAPSGPFGNLAARDVSMTADQWKTYGARPEQSFFANVPIRPSGITPVKPPGGQAPVNPGVNPAEAEPGVEVLPATPRQPLAVTNAPTQPASGGGLEVDDIRRNDSLGLARQPGFNPTAPSSVNSTSDSDMNRGSMTAEQFAVAMKRLENDRRAQPLPAPTKGFKTGGFAVRGPGTGRSDEIPARLSDGEYVIDAETVALLGDGSTQAGSKRLDDFRVNIRKHKGRQLSKGKFSHDARKPEAYLQGGRV